MSSSSQLSMELPDDVTIEEALRSAVIHAHRSGTADTLTVNKARAIAEKKLGLEEGLLKTHGTWKGKSKDIVSSASTEAQAETLPQTAARTEPTKNSKKPPTKPQTKKRASTEIESKPARKRQKQTVSDDDSVESSHSESENNFEDEEEVPTKARSAKVNKTNGASRQQNPAVPKHSDDGVSTKVQSKAPPTKSPEKDNEEDDEPRTDVLDTRQDQEDESELSDVIDEPIVKRKKGQKDRNSDTKSKSKPKASKPSKAPAARGKDLTTDEEEIKRLQSWLLKCGIRKLWHKELAPFEKPKAKIAHLKEMLADVGMSGRYSNEKAAEIKERRELAADLEAVKEGAKIWGTGSGSEDDDGERPARRKGVAARFVDFGDEDEDGD